MSEKNSKNTGSVNVPIRMPIALDADVTAATEELHLSKQDVIRLSIARGLVILRKQLTTQPELAA